MTLFGTHLDPMALMSIGMLLLALVAFSMRYRGDRSYWRQFRQWEAERKARRDAELARERGETPDDQAPRGPWG